MPGASPLADNLDTVRALEDAGAAAIVMHSLFEEQIALENREIVRSVDMHMDSSPEALSYLPEMDDYTRTPDEYLEHLARLKSAVGIPVFTSLNGLTPGGWVEYAREMEQAGADAIELNFYEISTSASENALDLEARAIGTLRAIKQIVKIPVAVKLSPFFSSLPNFAAGLVAAGADGLIFFNRFYQPDIDIEELEVLPALHLSEPNELNLRLRWLAIVSACVETSYAVTGGVNCAGAALKAIMTGANAVQLVSILLKRGPQFLETILNELDSWLEQHEYESVAQLRGSMNLKKSPDPSAFERGNYIRILQSWRF
jgi:dihydroorotate dehydrogenase (fumarate)